VCVALSGVNGLMHAPHLLRLLLLLLLLRLLLLSAGIISTLLLLSITRAQNWGARSFACPPPAAAICINEVAVGGVLCVRTVCTKRSSDDVVTVTPDGSTPLTVELR
jgi:hypothetical protein